MKKLISVLLSLLICVMCFYACGNQEKGDESSMVSSATESKDESSLGGISLMSGGDDWILPGIIVILLGSLISWVSSFLLYGFGQLVQNSDKLVENSDIIIEFQKKK